ncbi:Broad specificity phosphatase PhoE [Flavobacteriaceae bacterium MAR_2010_188]|nr:Broad specificity phosphatase PhoE [Flavobacteriaceae bacterium MAR_2010_188]
MVKMTCLFICLSLNLSSCDEKKSKDTKTVVSDNSEVTTYYLIRHAEKDRTDPSNDNPHLNEQGKERAIKWLQVLADVDFDAVYSTDFNRTRETAQPLASKNNLQTIIYDANNSYNEDFKMETQGKTVLIVGHSNTTPAFVNAILGENKYPDLDDNNNAALFKVTVKDGKATSQLTQY